MFKKAWDAIGRGWKWAWATPPGNYLLNVLISIDQLGNVVLLAGEPDETISSRMGRWRSSRKKIERDVADGMCVVLDGLDPNHCANAIEFDEHGNPRAQHLVPRKEVVIHEVAEDK